MKDYGNGKPFHPATDLTCGSAVCDWFPSPHQMHASCVWCRWQCLASEVLLPTMPHILRQRT